MSYGVIAKYDWGIVVVAVASLIISLEICIIASQPKDQGREKCVVFLFV